MGNTKHLSPTTKKLETCNPKATGVCRYGTGSDLHVSGDETPQQLADKLIILSDQQGLDRENIADIDPPSHWSNDEQEEFVNHVIQRLDDPVDALGTQEVEEDKISSENTSNMTLPRILEPKRFGYQLEGNINDVDFSPPQANDLEKIDTVLQAIEHNVNTTHGIGEALMDEKRTSMKADARKRDGHYYAEAAGYLGFVEKYSGAYEANSYSLTDLGRTYLDADNSEKAHIMRAAVENMPALEAYRQAGGGEEGRLAAAEAIGEGESTDDRRAGTVVAWAEKIDGEDFHTMLSEERTIADPHLQTAIANDKLRQQERQKKEEEARRKDQQKHGAQRDNEKQCMECFTVKNESLFAGAQDICIDCE